MKAQLPYLLLWCLFSPLTGLMVYSHPYDEMEKNWGTDEESFAAPLLKRDPSLRCDHNGFFNPVRWDESGAGPAYVEWSMLVDKSSPEWLERVSEPNFFALNTLGWPDMDCGVTYKGCVNMPTCDEIYSRKQNATLARRIYFIIRSMNNFNLVNGVISEESVATQLNVASMASNIANTFYWRHDDSLERKCKMRANIVKSVIGSAIAITMVIAPLAEELVKTANAFVQAERLAVRSKILAKEAADIVSAAEAGAATAAKYASPLVLGAAKEGAAVAKIGSASERGAQHLLEVRKMKAIAAEVFRNEKMAGHLKSAKRFGRSPNIEKFRTKARPNRITNPNPSTEPELEPELAPDSSPKQSAWARSRNYGLRMISKPFKGLGQASSAGANGVPLLVAGNDIEWAVCAGSPNPAATQDNVHKMELDKQIEKAALDFRRETQEEISGINKGFGLGENGTLSAFDPTVMSSHLFTGEFVKLTPAEHLRFVEEPIRIESELTSHFKNALISSVLRGQNCYLHCSRADLGFPYTIDPHVESSRFEPEPGTICQTRCWRNWKVGMNVEMYGLNDLVKPDNDWGLTIQDFSAESFIHWQQYRYSQNPVDLFPTVDEVLSDKVTTSSGSYLPVCYSDVILPHDSGSNREDKNRIHKSAFRLPCICGDREGNETELFFREVRMDKWVKNKNTDDREGLAFACQLSLSHVKGPPVSTFLTLCNNGWHLPNHGERRHRMNGARDKHCDAVKAEKDALLAQGYSFEKMNCHICFSTPIGKAIMHSQRTRWRLVFSAENYNFKKSCLDYDRKERCLW